MKTIPHWNTVVIVAAIGILQTSVRQGYFSMWHLMTGIILICLLSTCKAQADWSFQEIAVLCTTWGLTIVNALGIVLQKLTNPENPDIFFFFVWGMVSVAAYVGIAYSLKSQVPHAPKALTPSPGATEEPPPLV